MGVLNVTADSFSDGGCYLDVDAAVAHGRELLAQGADIVDVGGESTRPGAVRVDPEIEAARVAPVIAGLRAHIDATPALAGTAISVDTMRARVAEAAIAAGATIVNDVSGGRADRAMVKVLADAGIPWILMHWRPLESAADDHRDLIDATDLARGHRVLDARREADRPAGLLSHGQKQWLEIGMLLVQEPKLLLLDEPVAGMTDDETMRTAELFVSLAGKHSLVVVEHDMAFVEKLGGKVTVLHEGSVLAEGDLATVQNDQRVIEVYLGR